MLNMSITDALLQLLVLLAVLGVVITTGGIVIRKKRRKAARQQADAALEQLEEKLQLHYAATQSGETLSGQNYPAWREKYVHSTEEAHGLGIWQKCLDDDRALPAAPSATVS